MKLSETLLEYVAACFTGVWVLSHEHEDALAEIAQLGRDQKWPVAVWDIDAGLQAPSQQNRPGEQPSSADPLAAVRSLDSMVRQDRGPDLSPSSNRRMRSRMYGGVGAGTGNRPGYPIIWRLLTGSSLRETLHVIQCDCTDRARIIQIVVETPHG